MAEQQVYEKFFGDSSFPVSWSGEAEKGEFWWYDDLHCPKPISPMYFDVGGWWGDTCTYMFRRFGVPFGKEWPAKKINGYVYSAVLRRDDADAARQAPYFNMVLPVYANRFLDWWEKRYLPEIQANLEYIDTFPYTETSLPEMMIVLEDALDMQERHFRIHWILNLAQFAAFTQFSQVAAKVAGEGAAELAGKVLVSVQDRNWDSTYDLWKIKEKVKAQPMLVKVFRDADSTEAIRVALEVTPVGRELLTDIARYTEEYGYKAVYSHEYIYPLWKEDPTPIYEMLRGYLATDYDVRADQERVKREQENAIVELRGRIPSDAKRAEFEEALKLALAMAPLTPDHHFYIDQGTYARMRVVFLEIGKKLVARGDFDRPDDIFYLVYDEVRHLAADPSAFEARPIIAERRAELQSALSIAPRDWVGTADHWSLHEQGYIGLWGYPERFELSQKKSKEPVGEVHGLPASAGVVEGTARFVDDPEDFDKVRKGDILVCRMTNPAWTLVFTKISGLVTDSGGVLSHPAVVSREFGIPAVTSTLDGTSKIKSGQRVRVDGTHGVVYILGE